MKILMLNANLKGIGTYQRCFYFSRELARHKHDVTMFTVSRDAKYKPKIYYKRSWIEEYDEPTGNSPWVRMVEGPDFGHKWLPGWGSGPLDIAGRIRSILSEKYDVVYGFEYQPNVSLPVYLTRWLRPYTFFSDWCDWYAGSANWLRGYKWAHRIDSFLEERIRFSAKTVTVTSRVLQQRALSIGIPETNIAWIPQGVDTDYCKPFPKLETRLKLGLPTNRPTLLAVNHGDMLREIEIFNHVRQQLPNTLFIIVGSIRKKAQALAQRLGINDSIYWVGWASDEDYPQYLACADVCFLPLSDEFLNNHANWTGKFLDYLAVGCPVVTNDVGEEGALLREHEVGVIADQGNEALAAAIVRLLKDESYRHYLGKNARQLMVEAWDWRIRGNQIAQVVAGL